MNRHPFARRSLAVLVLFSFTGCYSYVPLEDTSPRRGDEVRVYGAPDDDGRSPSRSPAGDAYVQGVVIASTSDSLALWTRRMLRGGDLVEEIRRDTLAVALSDVRRIERSEVDALKTGGLVVGGLGLFVGVAVLVSNAEGSGGGDFGDGDGPTLRIQLPLP